MASTSNYNNSNQSNTRNTQSPYTTSEQTTTHSNSTSRTSSPPDTRMTSLVDLNQQQYVLHDPTGSESGGGGSLLQAPRPQFLSKSSNNNNNNNNSRPASFASTSSRGSSAGGGSGGGRVQLQSSLNYMTSGREQSTITSSRSELELREEFIGNGGVPGGRENLERPLETVNRLSRMWDTVPVPSLTSQTSSSSLRTARLPLAVGGFDPFGYGVSTEASPYDSALAYSSLPQNHKMSSRASWYPSGNSDENGMMTSNSFVGLAMMGGQKNATASTSSLAPPRSMSRNGGGGGDSLFVEKKRRSVSLGETGRTSRSSLRNSFTLGGRVSSGPSKLSGEIGGDNESIPISKGFVPPADSDYLQSKLYQRTLKAQKSLDKERAKKGTLRSISDTMPKSSGPKFEEELRAASLRKSAGTSFTTSDGNSLSGRSVLSNSGGAAGSAGGGGGGGKNKKGMGWFRSKSEVALTSLNSPPPPSMPPLPSNYRTGTPSPLPSNNQSSRPSFDNNSRSRSRQSQESTRVQQLQQQPSRPPAIPLPSPPLTSNSNTPTRSSPSSSPRRNQQQQQQHRARTPEDLRSNSPIIDYYSSEPSPPLPRGGNNFIASQVPLPPSPQGEYFSNSSGILHSSPLNSATDLTGRERTKSPLNPTDTSYQPQPQPQLQQQSQQLQYRNPSPPSRTSFEQENHRTMKEAESSSTDSSTSSPTTPLPSSLESIHPVIMTTEEDRYRNGNGNQLRMGNNGIYGNENGIGRGGVEEGMKKKSSFFSFGGGGKKDKGRISSTTIVREVVQKQPSQLQSSQVSYQLSDSKTVPPSKFSSTGGGGGSNFFGRAKKNFLSPGMKGISTFEGPSFPSSSASNTSTNYSNSPSPPTKDSPLPQVPGTINQSQRSKSFGMFSKKPFSSRSTTTTTTSNMNTNNSREPLRSNNQHYQYPSTTSTPQYTNVYN